METRIVVADSYQEHAVELSLLLTKQNFRTTPVYSFKDLKKYLKNYECLSAILNINNLSMDNRDIRDLTIKNPDVYFLGLTDKMFNPELREAICYHIFACLTLPFHPDHFFYWFHSFIYDDVRSEINSA